MNRLTLMQTQDHSYKSFSERRNSRTSLAAPMYLSPAALPGTLHILPSSGMNHNAVSAIDDTIHAVPQADACIRECTMLVIINADCVNELRHLMMRTCGRLLVFIRAQPVAHAKKMKVWLCLNAPAVDLVMDAVMRALPSAEFGRVTYA